MTRMSTSIIAVLLMVSVLMGVWLSLAQWADEDSVTIDSQSDTFDFVQQVQSNMTQMTEDVQQLSAQTDSAWGIITLIPDSLILVKNMFMMPIDILDSFVTIIVEILHLPEWFATLIKLVGAVAIIFGLIALIRGVQKA